MTWQAAEVGEKAKSYWVIPESVKALFRAFPHVVHLPKDGPANGFNSDTAGDVIVWATERFGPRMNMNDSVESTTARWLCIGSIVIFKNENEALEFKMRWG